MLENDLYAVIDFVKSLTCVQKCQKKYTEMKVVTNKYIRNYSYIVLCNSDIYREFIEINKHKKKLQIYIQQLMAAHIVVDNGYLKIK